MKPISVPRAYVWRHRHSPHGTRARNSYVSDPVNSRFKTDTFCHTHNPPCSVYKLWYLLLQAVVELKIIKRNFPWGWWLGPWCRLSLANYRGCGAAARAAVLCSAISSLPLYSLQQLPPQLHFTPEYLKTTTKRTKDPTLPPPQKNPNIH